MVPVHSNLFCISSIQTSINLKHLVVMLMQEFFNLICLWILNRDQSLHANPIIPSISFQLVQFACSLFLVYSLWSTTSFLNVFYQLKFQFQAQNCSHTYTQQKSRKTTIKLNHITGCTTSCFMWWCLYYIFIVSQNVTIEWLPSNSYLNSNAIITLRKNLVEIFAQLFASSVRFNKIKVGQRRARVMGRLIVE